MTLGDASTRLDDHTHWKGRVMDKDRIEGTGHKFKRGSVVLRWLLPNIPYIAMLLLALVGIDLMPPVIYWIILTPVFGIISIAAGWHQFGTGTQRLGLVYRVALDWCALLLALYLLSNSDLQAVMNVNARSLAMVTLLALGTFVVGVQARAWRICAVGCVLFLAVPGLGWLHRSPLLVAAAMCVVIALGGLAWWVSQPQHDTASPSAPATPSR